MIRQVERLSHGDGRIGAARRGIKLNRQPFAVARTAHKFRACLKGRDLTTAAQAQPGLSQALFQIGQAVEAPIPFALKKESCPKIMPKRGAQSRAFAKHALGLVIRDHRRAVQLIRIIAPIGLTDFGGRFGQIAGGRQ